MLRRQPTPPLFPYTTLFRSRVHRIGYAAVDMALDDDDVVGPLGPALDREHVGDLGRRRQTIAAECFAGTLDGQAIPRSEEHTSELQSRRDLVCRLLLEKKKK